jgi:hypothetical protein
MNKIEEYTNQLDPKDALLWQAMEALMHTLHELSRFPEAGNYEDAIVVFHKIESHFGVGGTV